LFPEHIWAADVTSDHYPISMSFKWEKLDKDLYRAMVTENSTALYERMRITTIS
jgi:hypothetical protein